MRKKRPIDALFPKIRQQVLAATFGQPERWWFLSELASQLDTSPSSLQRELEALAQSGILRRRRDGKRVYYQPEKNSPIFQELRGIVIKTLGLSEMMREMLAPLGDRIRCAFIYGSVAQREEHALSDIDLMVIGSAGLSDLAPRLRKFERTSKREINATVYRREEFRNKIRSGDHFLTSVLKKRKIFVKGSQDDLEALVGE